MSLQSAILEIDKWCEMWEMGLNKVKILLYQFTKKKYPSTFTNYLRNYTILEVD